MVVFFRCDGNARAPSRSELVGDVESSDIRCGAGWRRARRPSRRATGIRFPYAESLSRLVQPPLSPLPGQAEFFHAVQAPAEHRLLHFRLRLPISRTRGHGSRISCVTPVGSQHEAVWEAFPSRSEPISPSRSEPIKTQVWLTVPAAALSPLPRLPSWRQWLWKLSNPSSAPDMYCYLFYWAQQVCGRCCK